jgi:hypothetical protein
MMNYVRDCKLQGPRVDCRVFFFFAISLCLFTWLRPRFSAFKCLGDLAAICFFEFASERNESG